MGSPSQSGISRRWAWGVFEAPRSARPTSSWKSSALQPWLCSDGHTDACIVGVKAKRSPLGKLPSCTVSSHFQQRLWRCWLQALCWLQHPEPLCAGGARNSSAITRAKGQSLRELTARTALNSAGETVPIKPLWPAAMSTHNCSYNQWQQ